MDNTYYTPQEEERLVDVVHYVRDSLSLDQWNATAQLKEYAEISPDSLLWRRFSRRQLLDVPVAALMLSEALFLAEERRWVILEKELENSAYIQFTQKSHEKIIDQRRKILQKGYDTIMHTSAPEKKTADGSAAEASMFLPAYLLKREEEQAYVSWHNEIYVLSREDPVIPVLWSNLILDRADGNFLELSHETFYNSGLDCDIRERLKVKRFWR